MRFSIGLSLSLINGHVFFDIRLAQVDHDHHKSEEIEDETESEAEQRPAFGQRRVDERRLRVTLLARRLRLEGFDDGDGAERAAEE